MNSIRRLIFFCILSFSFHIWGQVEPYLSLDEYIEFSQQKKPKPAEASQLATWMINFVEIENRKTGIENLDGILPEALIALSTATLMGRDIYKNRQAYAKFLEEILLGEVVGPTPDYDSGQPASRYLYKTWLAQRFFGTEQGQIIESSLAKSNPTAYFENFLREMIVELPEGNESWPEFSRRLSRSPVNFIDYEIRYNRLVNLSGMDSSIKPYVWKMTELSDPLHNFLREYISQTQKIELLAKLYQKYGDELIAHTRYVGGETIKFDPNVLTSFNNPLSNLAEFFTLPNIEIFTDIDHLQIGKSELKSVEPVIFDQLTSLKSNTVKSFLLAYEVLGNYLVEAFKSAETLSIAKSNLGKIISYTFKTYNTDAYDQKILDEHIQAMIVYFQEFIFNNAKMQFIDTGRSEAFFVWSAIKVKFQSFRGWSEDYFFEIKEVFRELKGEWMNLPKAELKRKVRFKTMSQVDRIMVRYEKIKGEIQGIDKKKMALHGLGVAVLLFCGYEVVSTINQSSKQDGQQLGFDLVLDSDDRVFSLQLELPHFTDREEIIAYVADIAVNDIKSFQFYYNYFKALEQMDQSAEQ